MSCVGNSHAGGAGHVKGAGALARRLLLASWLVVGSMVGVRAEENPAHPASKFDPTSAYREQRIEGWRILVHERLLGETNLCERTLKLLGVQLYQITRAVPAGPLAKLRQIPIWVERSSKQFPCMCYHESREWLSTHGVNPEKTGAVELANPETFLTWTREQPWMVLHELAHGYHKLFLGEDHPELKRCYENAKAAGKYASVLRFNGRMEKHYALNNVKEYFAEATEAFFGTNDFYPFVRAELKEHDPEVFQVLWRVWELPPARD